MISIFETTEQNQQFMKWCKIQAIWKDVLEHKPFECKSVWQALQRGRNGAIGKPVTWVWNGKGKEKAPSSFLLRCALVSDASCLVCAFK